MVLLGCWASITVALRDRVDRRAAAVAVAVAVAAQQ
jgi:hypothetical protein